VVTDEELRGLIRESIARHLSAPAGPSAELRPALASHPSHALLPLARGGDGDGDGACLIEPSVRCNHCGYCLSYGH
jgi:hypothetical protein